MVLIEIAENPNCAPVDLRVFHDLAPSQPVAAVRLERSPGALQWHAVTGWTVAGLPCPARLQKVDDSGEGVAFLLYGGDAGLRLQPADGQTPWGLRDSRQWGESFLIVADRSDIRFAEASADGAEVTHG